MEPPQAATTSAPITAAVAERTDRRRPHLDPFLPGSVESCQRQEEPVQPVLPGELRVERQRDDLALPDRDGMPSTSASTDTSGPCSAIQGARMKIACTGPPSTPSTSKSASNECSWRPNALRCASTSRIPRCSRSSMIMPAQVPRIGVPAAASSRSGSLQPLALDPERHHRRLAARKHQRVESLQVGGHADLPRQRARARQNPLVRLEPALEREDPDERRRACVGALLTSRAARAAARTRASRSRCSPSPGPDPVDAAATRAGSA